MALLWTLFMSFFTYTSYWVALVSVGVSFLDGFVDGQSSIVSLVVNFGLVLMLIFDYMSSSDTSKKWMFGLFGISMFVAVMVYAHSLMAAQQRLNEFIMPISFPDFGITMHSLFMALLCGMKFVCLSNERNNTINLRSI